MDALDRQIVNELQRGFPLTERPFATVAEQFDIEEKVLIERVQSLLEKGILSRFGPMYHAEKLGGALSLCALVAPEERFEEIAALVNAHPEVAHNYARDHELNMWFVIATEKPEQVTQVISAIEKETGCRVFDMPKTREFFVGLHFEV